jgi:hypothetical protein
MRPTGAHRLLEQDGEITGFFALAGMTPEQAAPGVLRYSPADGSVLRLLECPPGWPTSLGHRGDLVVHGTTSDGGHRLTLLDARVSSIDLGDRVTGLRAATLALGAHCDRDTTGRGVTIGLPISRSRRSAIRRALRAHKVVNARITIRVADELGNTRTLSRTVRFKR